jgi:hypothetical protein
MFKLTVKNKGQQPYDKFFERKSGADAYVQDHCVGKPHAFNLATLYENGVAVGWYDVQGVFTKL